MVRRFFGIWCLLFCLLMGCGTSYQWSKSHPAYHQAPAGTLAVIGSENAFLLTRSSWFAKKLEIGADSVQVTMRNFCEKKFLQELSRFYPTLTKIPDKELQVFPEESQRLDERVFMKGRLPEQGISLKDSTGNIPPLVLILHEVIIGTDLKREDYFDYALMQNESPEKKTSNNLSAIASYTLWDNVKQRPLFSAVDEIQIPIQKPNLGNFEQMTAGIVQKIKENLDKGVVR